MKWLSILFLMPSLAYGTGITVTQSPRSLWSTTGTWTSVQNFKSSMVFVNPIIEINGIKYTWPSSINSNNCLKVDGSGNLSWGSCGGSGGGGGTSGGFIYNGSESVAFSSFSVPGIPILFDTGFATINVVGSSPVITGAWVHVGSTTFSSATVTTVMTSSNGYIGGGSSFTALALPGIQIYKSGTNTLMFREAGTDQFSFGANQFSLRTGVQGLFPNGTSGNPAIAFNNQVDSGLYLQGSGVVPRLYFNIDGKSVFMMQDDRQISFGGITPEASVHISTSPIPNTPILIVSSGIAKFAVYGSSTVFDSSATFRHVVISSNGYQGGGSTFTWISLSGSTLATRDYNIVFTSAPSAGQKIGVLQVNGLNVVLGGVGDQDENTGVGGGVSSIIAGTNITIDPPGGTGDVTINASGTGGAITADDWNVHRDTADFFDTQIVATHTAFRTFTATSDARGDAFVNYNATQNIALAQIFSTHTAFRTFTATSDARGDTFVNFRSTSDAALSLVRSTAAFLYQYTSTADARGDTFVNFNSTQNTALAAIRSTAAFVYQFTSTSDARGDTFVNFNATQNIALSQIMSTHTAFRTYTSTNDAQQNKFVNFRSTSDTAFDNTNSTMMVVRAATGTLADALGGRTQTYNNEGSQLTGGDVKTVDCVGAGITCTQSGSTVTLTVSGGAAVGYDTIQEEGGGITQRTTLNFIGSAITCADDAGNSRTNCTVTGGSGGGLLNQEGQYGIANATGLSVINGSVGIGTTQPRYLLDVSTHGFSNVGLVRISSGGINSNVFDLWPGSAVIRAPTTYVQVLIATGAVQGAGIEVSTIQWPTLQDGIKRIQQNAPGMEVWGSTYPDAEISTMSVTFSTAASIYITIFGSPTVSSGGDIFLTFNGQNLNPAVGRSPVYQVLRSTFGMNGQAVKGVSSSTGPAIGLPLWGPQSGLSATTSTMRVAEIKMYSNARQFPKLGRYEGVSYSSPSANSTATNDVCVFGRIVWDVPNEMITRVDAMFSLGTSTVTYGRSGGSKWKVGSGIEVRGSPY